jgi:amino acid adenylation domain-containing protein
MAVTSDNRKTSVHAATSDCVLPEPFRAWNSTATNYPRGATVSQLFEETAAKYPNAIALVLGHRHLTYSELNARANRLARRLREMGVARETMVGCCVERSFELIVAIIAILKAGGAYVPLDPAYPKERFDFLLRDTNTPLLLTQRSLAPAVLGDRAIAHLFVDDFEVLPLGEASENLAHQDDPRSLAYVMYTSGSTGQPKGALIENRAIVRLVRDTNFCRFGPDETFLLFAPISFDASTLEIWGPLLNGGRLVLMPPQTSSLEDLGRTIRDHRVTTLWLTTGLFNLMVEQRLGDLGSLRQFLAGGDVLSPRHVRLALEALPHCTLINGYGPTENATFTCCHRMRRGDRVPDSIPIGRPISNTQVYILDQELRPVPPGITGELYAGGDGVARGYLNSAAETAQKFASDPFAADPHARMYRTGDLARWREDGVVEFLGRVDSQVKILGHRIEPGEIETVLSMHEGVKQICVVARADESGSKRLVAYYVPAEAPGVSPSDLRKFLTGKLPHYMIPALLVPLLSLPLSPNGKIDRAALPEPPAAEATTPVEAPTDEREQVVVALWKRVLRIERLGLDENFFDLGGDSLLLVAVHSNLEKILKTTIPVTDLFEFTTVRTLARHLGEGRVAPAFSEARDQGQKQRQAFARQRERRGSGA